MDLGLLSGFAQGLKDGLLAYRDTKRYTDEMAMQEKKRAEDLSNQERRFALDERRFAQENEANNLKREDLLDQRKYEREQKEIENQFKRDQLNVEKSYKQGLLKNAQNKASKSSVSQANEKILPSDKVLSVQEGKNVPRLLDDIENSIGVNKDIFGPVQGGLTGLNPYSEKGKTIDAQLRTASQVFGKYLEGGVLRKEDEDKYRKMFPQLTDTPEVAENKLNLVRRMLTQKLQADTEALKNSGYDTRGLMDTYQIPDVPGVLKGKIQNTARPKLGPEDLEALQWAQGNANDPRAREIMKRLGR